MAKLYDQITEEIRAFIAQQHMFFVSSAPLSEDGHVNLSPKGLDAFRVLASNRVAYLDIISSGNETSAHLLENGRITFMFCSFEGAPNIVRLYGKGYTVLPNQPEWEKLAPNFTLYPSTRQIIMAYIDRVQTSCGYGVPLFTYTGQREQHFKWAEAKGKDGLAAYSQEHNLHSIDGLTTRLGLEFEEEEE
jgi:hypothetical protein